MSEQIASFMDVSTSEDDIASNTNGMGIFSQLSPSSLDPAATSHASMTAEPDPGDLQRLQGIYENLLGLAEAGIVPTVGDMAEALRAVGFDVHSETEVQAFVKFVALVKNGVDARSFEDFLASIASNESRSPDVQTPLVSKLKVEAETPSFPSEPKQRPEGGDTTLTLIDDGGSLFGSRPPSPSIFDSPDDSPERTQLTRQGTSDSLFDSPASTPSRSPTRAPPEQLQVGEDISDPNEQASYYQRRASRERSRSLLERKINVDSVSSRLSDSETSRNHHSRETLVDSTGDEKEKLRGEMDNALVQVGLLLDELAEGACKTRLMGLEGNLRNAVRHIDQLEKSLEDGSRLIMDSRRFVEEAQNQAKKIAIESERRHHEEVGNVRKAAAALREQLVESETSLDEVRRNLLIAEKQAEDADARCRQLMKAHRRQSFNASGFDEQESLIQQLEIEKRDLTQQLQKLSEQKDSLQLELRAEQRARACTLIWKIAEDKRALARYRAIQQEREQFQSRESVNDSSTQIEQSKLVALLSECEQLRSEGSAQQMNIDNLALEKTQLARENKQLHQEVEKLSGNLNELLALDADCRRRRQNHRQMCMTSPLADDAHEDRDPLMLDCDGVYSPGSPSPKDLMQELRESADWRSAKSPKARSFEKSEDEPDQLCIPSRRTTLMAVGMLKAQYCAEGSMLDRRTLLAKVLLGLRLVCSTSHRANASRPFALQTTLGEIFVAYRTATQCARSDRVRSALAEKVAAAACHARLARRRRRGQWDLRYSG